MNNCLFCKIIRKEIPCKVVFENDTLLAFHDVNPQAPIHILLIPKIHLENLLVLPENENPPFLAGMLSAVKRIVREKEIDAKGFRLVVNTGPDGGQTVSHLHFHLLGGRSMTWPPG
jgi:histidine triad (HIT) family protein